MLELWAAFTLWRYRRAVLSADAWDRRYKAVRAAIARRVWQR